MAGSEDVWMAQEVSGNGAGRLGVKSGEDVRLACRMALNPHAVSMQLPAQQLGKVERHGLHIVCCGQQAPPRRSRVADLARGVGVTGVGLPAQGCVHLAEHNRLVAVGGGGSLQLP